MKKILSVTLFFVFCLLFAYPSHDAYAQTGVEKLQFTFQADPKLKMAMYKAIDDVQEHKKILGSVPWLAFAFADLNNDKKNEIFVKLTSEYLFTDKFGNNTVHGFSQTSKGLVKIFESPAQDIGIGLPDGKTGLKTIHVYKNPKITDSVLFYWDGEKQYVEQKK